MKSGYSKILISSCLLSASLFCGGAEAQEKFSANDVQNEMLRASLSKNASGDKPLTAEDLEKANKKLQAAEARLLEKGAASGIAPILPGANGKRPTHVEHAATPQLKEVDIPPAAPPQEPSSGQASLDLNKVIAAIDNAPVENNQPASIRIERKTKPAKPGDDLTAKNAELEKELTETRAKMNDVLKELDETRNRLMIAETQVERLSSIIDSGAKRSGKSPASSNSADSALSMSRAAPAPALRQPAHNPDMQIAVVTAEKVHLRTGPGKENSPLMAVTKGTRLAVEIKNGDWYRVIAPTGARAWVSENVISFSTADKIKSASQGRVAGFDHDREPF